jgi:chromosome segregation ATPase
LFETRFVASSALQDLEQERQVRQRCSDAYKELHVQYRRNVAEMHEMTTKCVSLHKELKESQKTLSHYESSFEEFKRRAAENKDRIGDLERGRVETTKQIKVVIDRDNSARKRIDELEKERGDLIQGHRAAISVRMARECLAKQRIDELQEGVDALIREHQAVMNIAIDRMNSAEQKVGEFRKIISTSKH